MLFTVVQRIQIQVQECWCECVHTYNQENVHLSAPLCMTARPHCMKVKESELHTERTHMSMIAPCNNRVEIYAHKIYTKQLVLGVCCIMCTEWLKLKQLTISCIMHVRIQLCTEAKAKTSKTKPFRTVYSTHTLCMLVCNGKFTQMHYTKVEPPFSESVQFETANFHMLLKQTRLDLCGLLQLNCYKLVRFRVWQPRSEHSAQNIRGMFEEHILHEYILH